MARSMAHSPGALVVRFMRNSFTARMAVSCPAPSPIISARRPAKCRGRQFLHMESPSPLSPLGAKGLAEGNCMSTPVCIANAVADALGVKDVRLPLTPPRIKALMGETERPPRTPRAKAARSAPADSAARQGRQGLSGDRLARGTGLARGSGVATLLDPARCWLRTIPGCHKLDQLATNDYRAESIARRWRHQRALHRPGEAVRTSIRRRPRPCPAGSKVRSACRRAAAGCASRRTARARASITTMRSRSAARLQLSDRACSTAPPKS